MASELGCVLNLPEANSITLTEPCQGCLTGTRPTLCSASDLWWNFLGQSANIFFGLQWVHQMLNLQARYLDITVDPNFSTIAKLPSTSKSSLSSVDSHLLPGYAKFGKISTEGTDTSRPGETQLAKQAATVNPSEPEAQQEASSDAFIPTRRVRDPPGGISNLSIGHSHSGDRFVKPATVGIMLFFLGDARLICFHHSVNSNSFSVQLGAIYCSTF